MAIRSASKKLKKDLTLFDVYAISTGAMFSSGFFLLPGLASAVSGPSVVLAYLLASLLILPAMFSKAELCTAMPKAGGTQILANIASRIDEAQFMGQWLQADGEQDLKETLLLHDRYLSIRLSTEDGTASLIGQALKDLDLPPGILIALIHRGKEITVPGGNTVLQVNDRITIIGETKGIQQLYTKYRAY